MNSLKLTKIPSFQETEPTEGLEFIDNLPSDIKELFQFEGILQLKAKKFESIIRIWNKKIKNHNTLAYMTFIFERFS